MPIFPISLAYFCWKNFSVLSSLWMYVYSRVSIIGWLKSLILIATYQIYLCFAKFNFGSNRSDSNSIFFSMPGGYACQGISLKPFDYWFKPYLYQKILLIWKDQIKWGLNLSHDLTDFTWEGREKSISNKLLSSLRHLGIGNLVYLPLHTRSNKAY